MKHEQNDRDRELQAFGMVLKRIRNQQRQTQEQLAWDTQMEQTYISQLERGLKEPGIRTVRKIAHALGTTASHIMAEVEKMLEQS